MDNRAIGVFDSGLGGLTAVSALRELLPNENIVYFGDTGRVPYGTRSAETIWRYAAQDVRFLLGQDIKCIVVACGTVSSVAFPKLHELTELPILGVISPTVKAAVRASRNRRIGVVGTNATIRSDTYRRGLLEEDPSIQVLSKPCSLLVPLVEDGRFSPGCTVTEMMVQEYVSPLLEQKIDTLILGCTHYPLLTDIFHELCGDSVSLINPGYETVLALRQLLLEQNALREDPSPSSERYYVSDSEQQFLQYAEMFLQNRVRGPVQRIDIESY
ncbi:MAG: glutamate racemase [Clostridia bacterium]|jgi:glutamate racemase|nr:glutamate racemase [Clostridia bacterium]MBQ6059328.1 glutamate racemase [Clostridia bacterium]